MPILSSGRKTVGLAMLVLVFTGCSLNPKQDPSRFYVLTPAPAAEGEAAAYAGTAGIESLGVGPVKFPAYLDRPQMVTRLTDVEVSVSEYERWAEPPRSAFTSVLAHNLEVELRGPRVETYPYVAGVDYAVRVEVRHFERDTAGVALLECRWVIVDSDLSAVLSRESTYRESAADTTTEASVAALSRTVQRLSLDVAQALRGLPPRDN